jgi:drug/metabolite transporter (DMT)-like permease
MKRETWDMAVVTGVGLVLSTTLVSATADGLTKHLTGSFAPPQLYFFCGLVVAGMSVLMNRVTPSLGPTGRLATRFGRMLALRTALVLISVVSYYHAFANLPLAEVFVFIGMMPLLAAILSRPVLGEPVAPAAWAALSTGAFGILFLFPQGLAGIGWGHMMAASGVMSGTLSLVLMRRMTKLEPNTLAQVFWPHAAMVMVMGLALPFVWQPMSVSDAGLVAAYACAVFLARWLMVPALQRLKAHVAMMLMNLQFVWMVVIGRVAFGEVPEVGTLIGAGCIIGAGCFLVLEQARLKGELPVRRAVPPPHATPAE